MNPLSPTSPLLRRALVVCWAWFALAKAAAAWHYHVPGETVFQLSFGFGDYVRSLSEHGTFADCSRAPTCERATRMPLLPALIALLAWIASSPSLLVVTLLKNALMSLLVLGIFVVLLREQRRFHPDAAGHWVPACTLLALAPTVIKHAAYSHYEEGLLVELLFLWTIALLTTACGLGRDATGRFRAAPLCCLGLAVAAWYTKSSMLPILVLSLGAAVAWSWRARDATTACAVLLALAAALVWGVRNEAVSGRFSLGTSWDGANLYHGWCAEGRALYPDVVLDRIVDAPVAWTRDGRRVVPHPPPCAGGNEWAANDCYVAAARAWAEAEPGAAAAFTLRKAQVLLAGVRKTPYTYGVDARQAAGSRGENVVVGTWLALGRVLEAALLVLAITAWRRSTPRSRPLVVAALLVNAAYALPYLVGFAYERHVTPYLVIVTACVVFLSAELRVFSRR